MKWISIESGCMYDQFVERESDLIECKNASNWPSSHWHHLIWSSHWSGLVLVTSLIWFGLVRKVHSTWKALLPQNNLGQSDQVDDTFSSGQEIFIATVFFNRINFFNFSNCSFLKVAHKLWLQISKVQVLPKLLLHFDWVRKYQGSSEQYIRRRRKSVIIGFI